MGGVAGFITFTIKHQILDLRNATETIICIRQLWVEWLDFGEVCLPLEQSTSSPSLRSGCKFDRRKLRESVSWGNYIVNCSTYVQTLM